MSSVSESNNPERIGNADAVTPVSLRLLLRVWLRLSCQSFGGATLALIRRAVIEEQKWMTEAEFTRDWALVQVAPGINLFALTILIGRRLAGGWGIVVCLLGLLLPSVTLTVAITAFFRSAQHLHVVQAALRGVLPATVGIGLVTSWNMARPVLRVSRKESGFRLSVSLLLLAGSGVMMALWKTPVAFLLVGAGGLNALAHRLAPAVEKNAQEEREEGKETEADAENDRP